LYMSNERKAAKATDKQGPLWFDAKARVVARISLAVCLSLVALWIARDFLAPLGWAIVIAVTTWPVYSRFVARFPSGGQRFLVPALFTVVVGLLIFLPVGLALHRASQDGAAVAEALSRFRETGIPVPGWLGDVPAVGQHISEWWRVNLSDAKAAHQWIGSGSGANNTDAARAMGVEVLHRTFLFVFALLALFGLLRHGPWMASRVMDTADKILGAPGERLTFKMVDAIRGTVNGTVVVAVSEGAVIGIAYVLADVPYPLLLTLLTMAFAMLPFGAWAVFATASLLLVLQGGSPYAALGVFLFGAIVMLIGDTFLWPAMVGNAARLPFVIALIGIFGGLQSFGLIGLFLGPIIMAALMIVWREWLIGSKT
jgi:predicted PurR-regulated permease PerM